LSVFANFDESFFENFENLGGQKFFGEITKDVNMIRDTANRNRAASQILKNARLIRPDALADVRTQPRMTSFGRKDDVRL
jgi:hypothetical protein